MKTEGYAKANNKQIYYEWVNPDLRGEKPVMVFMHDALGSIGQWKDFPEVMSNELGFPALVYDRYGHGKSEGLTEKRTVDYLHVEAFEFLPQLLEALNINEPLILIGHSDGAAIALLYASRFPDRVKALISEAGHVFVEEEMKQGIQKSVDTYHESDKLKTLFERFHGDNTESIFFAWADIWRSGEFNDWNIEEYLPNIKAPVLAIQGEDDEFGHLRQPKPIVEQVGGYARELWVKDCSHIPHHQKRDLIKKEMADFIREAL